MKNYDKNKKSSYKYMQCKQFVWMGNVSKIVCRWFRIEKKYAKI